MKDLKSITLDEINDLTVEQWLIFADIFIYGKDTNIFSIELRNMILKTPFTKGLKKSF